MYEADASNTFVKCISVKYVKSLEELLLFIK